MAFNTEVQVTNKVGTTLDVNVTNTTINDTVIVFEDDSITEGLTTNIAAGLDVDLDIVVKYIGVVGLSGGVFKLKLYSSLAQNDLFFQCYIGDNETINLTPNVIYPAPNSDVANNFAYAIERISGSGVPVEITIIYSTPTS